MRQLHDNNGGNLVLRRPEGASRSMGYRSRIMLFGIIPVSETWPRFVRRRSSDATPRTPATGLLGMAASQCPGVAPDPASRDRLARLPVPGGDCSGPTPGHSKTPRQRRGSAPAPRFAMAKAWPDGSASSNTLRGGRGAAPRRRRVPKRRNAAVPSPGTASRGRRSREAGSRTIARRSLAAMPSNSGGHTGSHRLGARTGSMSGTSRCRGRRSRRRRRAPQSAGR